MPSCKSTPWITAKFLVFAHNWREIPEFGKKVREAGADEAVFLSGFANGNYVTGCFGIDFEFNLMHSNA